MGRIGLAGPEAPLTGLEQPSRVGWGRARRPGSGSRRSRPPSARSARASKTPRASTAVRVNSCRTKASPAFGCGHPNAPASWLYPRPANTRATISGFERSPLPFLVAACPGGGPPGGSPAGRTCLRSGSASSGAGEPPFPRRLRPLGIGGQAIPGDGAIGLQISRHACAEVARSARKDAAAPPVRQPDLRQSEPPPRGPDASACAGKGHQPLQ